MGYSSLEQKLTDIAQAMRNLDGTTQLKTLADMKTWLTNGWEVEKGASSVSEFVRSSSFVNTCYPMSGPAGVTNGTSCLFYDGWAVANASGYTSGSVYYAGNSQTGAGMFFRVNSSLTRTSMTANTNGRSPYFSVNNSVLGAPYTDGTQSDSAVMVKYSSSWTASKVTLGITKANVGQAIEPSAAWSNGYYSALPKGSAKWVCNKFNANGTVTSSAETSLNSYAPRALCCDAFAGIMTSSNGSTYYYGWIGLFNSNLTYVGNFSLIMGVQSYYTLWSFKDKNAAAVVGGYTGSDYVRFAQIIDSNMTIRPSGYMNVSSYQTGGSVVYDGLLYAFGPDGFTGNWSAYILSPDGNVSTVEKSGNSTQGSNDTFFYANGPKGVIGNKLVSVGGGNTNGYASNWISSATITEGSPVKVSKKL